MPERLLALMVLLAALGLAVQHLRQAQLARRLRDRIFHLETLRSEGLRLQQAELRLAEIQRLTESAISGSTQVIRAVHRGIAAVPFTVLDNIPATREGSRVVRRVHDAVSDGVYGGIGVVNRGIGALLRQGLSEAPAGAGTSPDPDPQSGRQPDSQPEPGPEPDHR